MSIHPNARNGTWQGWPGGLFGMLFLIGTVEVSLARNLDSMTYIHSHAWKKVGEAVPKAAKCDIVAFGDSLVKNGVIPPAIEARLGPGYAMYNLALSGGPATAHYFLLRRLLDARGGLPPRAILFDGETLTGDPLLFDQRWTMLLSFSDLADIARTCGRLPFVSATALAKVFPSIFGTPQIRRRFTMRLGGETWMDTDSLAVFMRNWKRNGGAEILPMRAEPPGQDTRLAELERMNYWPTRWVPDPISVRYNERFLSLAASNKIMVFWLLPPFHPAIEARRVSAGWYPQYIAYVQRLQERFPNLVVIDGRDAGYVPGALYDTTHLSRLGAICYSDALGTILGKHLDRPGPDFPERWITLPKYDAARAEMLANASPLEDTKRSGVELARVMDAIRNGKSQAEIVAQPPTDPEKVRR